MPDSPNFDTTCDNDNYNTSNTGPAFEPPDDDDQFVLQCRDPANASHTGITQTKTVAYGDLVAMGYPLGANNHHNGRCSLIDRWAVVREHAHRFITHLIESRTLIKCPRRSKARSQRLSAFLLEMDNTVLPRFPFTVSITYAY